MEAARDYYKSEFNELVSVVEKSRYRTFNATKNIFYSDVWTYEIPRVKDRHVCEKPLDMMLDIIKTTTSEGQYVLDAFAGSGVVGEACARLNRNFIGIEQQAKWADKGNLRIRYYSAQKHRTQDINTLGSHFYTFLHVGVVSMDTNAFH